MRKDEINGIRVIKDGIKLAFKLIFLSFTIIFSMIIKSHLADSYLLFKQSRLIGWSNSSFYPFTIGALFYTYMLLICFTLIGIAAWWLFGDFFLRIVDFENKKINNWISCRLQKLANIKRKAYNKYVKEMKQL